MWSIERRHFQWPWTTPNPFFKVTLFFDAEYLINGKNTAILLRKANKKSHPSFRMVPVCMTFSDLFKVTMIQRQITLKWYIYSQWPTNKKSNDLSICSIFNDLERPLPPVSRSRRFLTLNISETVRHTDSFNENTNSSHSSSSSSSRVFQVCVYSASHPAVPLCANRDLHTPY